MDCEKNEELNNVYFLWFFLHDFYNILFYILFYFFVSVVKSLTEVVRREKLFSIYKLNFGVYSRRRFTLASDESFLNSPR